MNTSEQIVEKRLKTTGILFQEIIRLYNNTNKIESKVVNLDEVNSI